MAIKIGHASIGENGKVAGGASGDQTGKEVCIRTYYTSSWDVVLRPKRESLAEKSATFVEQICKNPNVGYDQSGRNTLFVQAKRVKYNGSKVAKCECDCSALQNVAAIAGGANLTYGNNGFTTRTMVDRLVASGDYEKLTDKKYLTSDKYLKRGDILVNIGVHTVMALENGSKVSNKEVETVKIELNVLRAGHKGEQVETVQRLLKSLGYNIGKSGIDGDYGNSTLEAVKQFQKDRKITVDGVVGEKTWSELLK